MSKVTIADWRQLCLRGVQLLDNVPESYWAETSEQFALDMLSVAHMIAGVACPGCGGSGRKAYASTSTWRGGIGGQMITEGVCDKCWGTGRTDRKGVNLREYEGMLRQQRSKDYVSGPEGGGSD
jgi:hypothetical protein